MTDQGRRLLARQDILAKDAWLWIANVMVLVAGVWMSPPNQYLALVAVGLLCFQLFVAPSDSSEHPADVAGMAAEVLTLGLVNCGPRDPPPFSRASRGGYSKP